MTFIKQQFVVAPQSSSVSYDATGTPAYLSASAQSSATLNGSHTAAGGAKNVVLLFVDAETNGPAAPPTITATYNGVSMTALSVWNYAVSSPNYANVAVFYLFNPPTGAQTVSTTVSTSGASDYFITANTVSYNGVSTLGTLVSNSGNSSSAALSVPCVANGMVSMMFGDTSSTTFGVFSSYNKTERFNNNADSLGTFMVIGDSNTTPTANFTASLNWGLNWGALGVPLNP